MVKTKPCNSCEPGAAALVVQMCVCFGSCIVVNTMPMIRGKMYVDCFAPEIIKMSVLWGSGCWFRLHGLCGSLQGWVRLQAPALTWLQWERCCQLMRPEERDAASGLLREQENRLRSCPTEIKIRTQTQLPPSFDIAAPPRRQHGYRGRAPAPGSLWQRRRAAPVACLVTSPPGL